MNARTSEAFSSRPCTRGDVPLVSLVPPIMRTVAMRTPIASPLAWILMLMAVVASPASLAASVKWQRKEVAKSSRTGC